MIARVVVVAAVCVIWPVGCGGAHVRSPAEQARSVVERFYADFRSSDGSAACSLLASELRQSIATREGLACATVIDRVALSIGKNAALARKLRDTKIGHATVFGDHATVELITPDGRHQVYLVRTGNGWRVQRLNATL